MADFSDTFTDTATTLLTAHTPDVGGSWVKHASYAGTAEISNANRARSTGTSSTSYYVENAASASANVTVTAVGRPVTLQLVTAALLARFVDASTDSGYLATYSYAASAPNNKYRIYKVVTGTFTELGATAETLTAATDYAWSFVLSGSTLTLTVDSAQKVQVTGETTHTAAGRSGLRFQAGATVGDTVGWHWDTYTNTAAVVRPRSLLTLGVGV